MHFRSIQVYTLESKRFNFGGNITPALNDHQISYILCVIRCSSVEAQSKSEVDINVRRRNPVIERA